VFSDQDSEDNYKYAMHVVDINNPTQSLVLIKPTRPTDSAGNVGDYLATHNGGQRWHGNEASWQYRTILEWVRGGRLEASEEVVCSLFSSRLEQDFFMSRALDASVSTPSGSFRARLSPHNEENPYAPQLLLDLWQDLLLLE
jgi:hypothetical protein